MDRCTPTNQIIFLSYIKNIFFKITNIFFIVSSNNEVINQKLYIEKNKEEYEIENLETIMKNEINKKNNDFYSLIKETNSKELLNKIEFVIFYIYYLKFSKKRNIIIFSNF